MEHSLICFRALDNEQIYSVWRVLAALHQVSGMQVHDARLVAAMQVHGITNIFTVNQPDFIRYSSISVVHPQNVPA